MSSGTRVLRLVSVLGVAFAVARRACSPLVSWSLRLSGEIAGSGWPSMMVVVLLSTGAILFSLGVIAEYIGVAVNMAMGKPLYLIVSDPAAARSGATPRR